MKKIILVANTSWYIYNFRKLLLKEIRKRENCMNTEPDTYERARRRSGLQTIHLQEKAKIRSRFKTKAEIERIQDKLYNIQLCLAP